MLISTEASAHAYVVLSLSVLHCICPVCVCVCACTCVFTCVYMVTIISQYWLLLGGIQLQWNFICILYNPSTINPCTSSTEHQWCLHTVLIIMMSSTSCTNFIHKEINCSVSSRNTSSKLLLFSTIHVWYCKHILVFLHKNRPLCTIVQQAINNRTQPACTLQLH